MKYKPGDIIQRINPQLKILRIGHPWIYAQSSRTNKEVRIRIDNAEYYTKVGYDSVFDIITEGKYEIPFSSAKAALDKGKKVAEDYDKNYKNYLRKGGVI